MSYGHYSNEDFILRQEHPAYADYCREEEYDEDEDPVDSEYAAKEIAWEGRQYDEGGENE